MGLSEDENGQISRIYDDTLAIKERFQDQILNVKRQLLSNQQNLFLTLSSVVIAFHAVLFAVDAQKTNSYVIVSFILALCALIYAITYIREYIDSEDGELNKLEVRMKIDFNRMVEVMENTKRTGDFSLFENWRDEWINRKNKEHEAKLSFAAEIFILMFLSSVFFGLASMFEFNSYCFWFLSIIIPLFSFLITFAKWNRPTTEFISIILTKIGFR